MGLKRIRTKLNNKKVCMFKKRLAKTENDRQRKGAIIASDYRTISRVT